MKIKRVFGVLATGVPEVRLVIAWLAALLCAAAGGCRTVPAGDFSAYKEAFAQGRSAGEQVLLDYAAAMEQTARLQKAVDDAKDAQEAAARKISVVELRAEREEAALLEFPVAEVAAAEQVEDAVGVRMRAWEVIAAYNDALTKLAEGRPASEVESAVGGLLQSLQSLPIAAVQSAMKAAAPFVPDVTQIVALVRRQLELKQFAQSVRSASPLIKGFLQLLRADVKDMYEIRFALYKRDGLARRNQARDLQTGMVPLLTTFGGQATTAVESTDQELVDQTNAALLQFHKWNRANLLAVPARATNAVRTPEAQAQLVDMATQVKALGEQVESSRLQMLAYREVVVNYVRLLHELERRIDALATATEQAPRTLPPITDVLRFAVNVRRALATYQNAKSAK